MPSQIAQRTKFIKQKAQALGFDFCGISKATFLEDQAPKLENWLKAKAHGEMQWMENHFDKRLDPRKLVPGAKSVISLLLNYYPEDDRLSTGEYKISRYAYGRDYHKVLKNKCKALMQSIKEEMGEIEGRAFVDSAPVMDKVWAEKSGLGWIGKNTNLINKGNGSYFFIAEIILDLELQYDSPTGDYCGTCTKCIDACPTDAIESAYVVNGSKCISYLTIELKDKIPEEFKGKMADWIYGCDICQDVCPWNRFSTKHTTTDFDPKTELKEMTKKDWEEITEDVFEKIFNGSAVKRTRFEGLKRNINFLKF